MVKHPISRKCPTCHGIDFKRVAPEAALAFTDDRVCKSCGTRYTPPTPLWAAVIFLVVGIVIILLNIAAGVVASNAGRFWFSVRIGIFHSLTLPVGIGCVIYGIRCIRRQDEELPQVSERIVGGDGPE